MKIGDVLKKVFSTAEGKFAALLIVVAAAASFGAAKLLGTEMFGMLVQLLCCGVAVYATQQLVKLVTQAQNEYNESNKANKSNKKKK